MARSGAKPKRATSPGPATQARRPRAQTAATPAPSGEQVSVMLDQLRDRSNELLAGAHRLLARLT